MGKMAIFIYDNSDERRISLANAFRGLIATRQFFRNAHGDLCITVFENAEHEEVDALCCLVHVRDRRMYENYCPSGSHLVVYYGGNGGDDKDIPKDADRIWRPLLSSSGVLTGTEPSELINYATHLRSALSTRPVFLLSPSPSCDFCACLSILCQGFLAQYALNPTNCVNHAINTKGCADVRTALKSMGWVNEDGSKPEIVKELEHQRSTKSVDESQSERDEAERDKSSISNSELDFWQSPFDVGKSLREGLEEECGAIRKIVESKIQNGTLVWPEDLTLPSRTAELVEAIEKANGEKLSKAEPKNNPLFDQDFIYLVAKAYLELNILLEAV